MEETLVHTPTHFAEALRNKDSQTALRLVTQTDGAGINLCKGERVSPLMLACEAGLADVALELLRRGARVNHLDIHARSALIVACDRGLADVALRLVELGANVNQISHRLEMPLMLACDNRLAAVAVALLKHDAKTDLLRPTHHHYLQTLYPKILANKLVHTTFM